MKVNKHRKINAASAESAKSHLSVGKGTQRVQPWDVRAEQVKPAVCQRFLEIVPAAVSGQP